MSTTTTTIKMDFDTIEINLVDHIVDEELLGVSRWLDVALDGGIYGV